MTGDVKRHLLYLSVLILPGCSQLLTLDVYNNTSTRVEVCNPLRHKDPCVVIGPRAAAPMLLTADDSTSSWQFRIKSDDGTHLYSFGADGSLRPLRSKRCMLHKPCLAVRIESDGLLYWADSSGSAQSSASSRSTTGVSDCTSGQIVRGIYWRARGSRGLPM